MTHLNDDTQSILAERLRAPESSSGISYHSLGSSSGRGTLCPCARYFTIVALFFGKDKHEQTKTAIK